MGPGRQCRPTYLGDVQAGAHAAEEEEGARRMRLREEGAEQQRSEEQARRRQGSAGTRPSSSHCSASACGWAASASSTLGSRCCHQQCECHAARAQGSALVRTTQERALSLTLFAAGRGRLRPLRPSLRLARWLCSSVHCCLLREKRRSKDHRPAAGSRVVQCRAVQTYKAATADCDKAATFRQLSRARRQDEEIQYHPIHHGAGLLLD